MKLHYYSVTFIDQGSNGEMEHANSYIGCQEHCLTLTNIAEARDAAKVSASAVMQSASYLGHMTQEEFNS